MLSNTFSTSMAIYYFTHVVPNPMLAGVAMVLLFVFMIPGSIIAPLLGGKLGKKRAIMLGICLSICGKLVMLTGNTAILFGGLGMTGLGLGIAVPLLTTLMPDIVDYGEWKNNASTPGILYSALSLGSKLGNGLAVSVVMMILATSGYDATLAAQPASAVSAIAMSYIFVPLVCDGIALLGISLYRIDRIRGKIQSELAERHAAVGMNPMV